MAEIEHGIFSWESWSDIDSGHFQFEDVKFLKDFGPFKAGEVVYCLTVNYQSGKMEAFYHVEDETPKVCKFTLAPVENA
jgi:hypothetical protein